MRRIVVLTAALVQATCQLAPAQVRKIMVIDRPWTVAAYLARCRQTQRVATGLRAASGRANGTGREIRVPAWGGAMRPEDLAESCTALAVAEIVEWLGVKPEERAEVMQQLCGPILSAVLSFAAMRPKRLKRRFISLKPSLN